MADIELDQLQPGGPWVICEAITAWDNIGPRRRAQYVHIGARGYLKRNEFDPRYIQILILDSTDTVVGFYFKIKDAIRLVWPERFAPASAVPDVYWSGYWRGWGYLPKVGMSVK